LQNACAASAENVVAFTTTPNAAMFKRRFFMSVQSARLELIESAFIHDVLDQIPAVREGTVMCVGPAPYRRLDCGGRALAYVRLRPRKGFVRVDVSGLWRAPAASALRVPGAGGAASLALRTEADRRAAVEFLKLTIEETQSREVIQIRAVRRPPRSIVPHQSANPMPPPNAIPA
jgi:hypothetical protein